MARLSLRAKSTVCTPYYVEVHAGKLGFMQSDQAIHNYNSAPVNVYERLRGNPEDTASSKMKIFDKLVFDGVIFNSGKLIIACLGHGAK